MRTFTFTKKSNEKHKEQANIFLTHEFFPPAISIRKPKMWLISSSRSLWLFIKRFPSQSYKWYCKFKTRLQFCKDRSCSFLCILYSSMPQNLKNLPDSSEKLQRLKTNETQDIFTLHFSRHFIYHLKWLLEADEEAYP